MKKSILIFTAIISITANAQTWKPEYNSKKSKYGFVNAKGVFKDPIYEYAKLINEKYSWVQSSNNNLYGIIDNNTLKPIIPITQENIVYSNFHIVVRNKTTYELYDLNLNKKGVFNYIELPSTKMNEVDYTITVKNEQGKLGLLNYKSEEILPLKYDHLRAIYNTDLYAAQENKNDPSILVINKKGQLQFSKTGLYMINDVNENYYIAQLYINDKIENVLLDKKGNTVLKLSNRASFLKSFSSDKIKYDNCNLIDLEGTGSYPNVKHSLLNIKGEELIVPDNWFFSILNCNLIKIQKNKGNGEYIFGVYDLASKKLIIPIEYPKIELRENDTKIMAGKSSVYNIEVEYDLFDLMGIKLSSYKKP